MGGALGAKGVTVEQGWKLCFSSARSGDLQSRRGKRSQPKSENLVCCDQTQRGSRGLPLTSPLSGNSTEHRKSDGF